MISFKISMEIKHTKKNSIPPEATRVFKGVIFDVYQWEQKMYDGTTATFEKLKRPDTALVIPVLPDGRILISEQEQPNKPPYIGLLGGRIDEGEDALEAAKRELSEESGYTSNDWSVFAIEEPVAKIEWTIYTFVARNCEKTAEQKLDGGEKITLKTVTFEEFLDLSTNEKFYDLGLKMIIREAKLDPEKMAELKKKILG